MPFSFFNKPSNSFDPTAIGLLFRIRNVNNKHRKHYYFQQPKPWSFWENTESAWKIVEDLWSRRPSKLSCEINMKAIALIFCIHTEDWMHILCYKIHVSVSRGSWENYKKQTKYNEKLRLILPGAALSRCQFQSYWANFLHTYC